jgi:transcriptional regulator with XRE-family HTH domain
LDYYQNLSAYIREQRKLRKWTREAIAVKAGLTVSTIGTLEGTRGMPPGTRLGTLEAIASALEIPLDQLMTLASGVPLFDQAGEAIPHRVKPSSDGGHPPSPDPGD